MTIEARKRDYGFVYGIRSLDLIKIGVADDIQKRMKVMGLSNPHGLELVFYRNVFAPFRFERRMHEILADKSVGREWFRVTTSELRVAAARAKSRSVSEFKNASRNAAEWAGRSEIVTQVAQSFTYINEIKGLDQ